jgi:transcriptional regulator with XRE-family HTH domain
VLQEHTLDREKPYYPRNLIGSRLREIRRESRPRVSQEDLCGRVALDGVVLTRTQIAKIEAGTRPVSDCELLAFARALAVDITVFFPRSRSR